ncbi:MAG: hypothetical protein JRK53_17540 [Deltaproteobacteria bacterium]|nr:hypothetical protein [Deltaproteobacteria bacterium]
MPAFFESLITLGHMMSDCMIDDLYEITFIAILPSRFRILTCDALNSHKQVLAGIPLKGNEFIRKIKQRSDIHLFEVTRGNRDRLPEKIVEGFL